MNTLNLKRTENAKPIMAVILDRIGRLELTLPARDELVKILAAFSKVDAVSEVTLANASEVLNNVYEACTMILNCNTEQKKITLEEASDLLPIDCVFSLIEEYSKRIEEFKDSTQK